VKAKVVVVSGILVVIGIVAAALLLSGRKPEWTTSSPKALAEFEQGLDSLQKIYYNEANKHFEKAVALDPGFAAAERFLLVTMERPSSDPEVKKLVADLQKADLSRLNDRERFLVAYTLANFGKDPAKAQEVLQEYATRNPNDPFALEALASRAADRQDWPESRRLLTRLIEVAPNRVIAYNQLGYLDMGLGQFAQSEKMFGTYRYIAPDQANPRDSLGELYVLIGRYDDAQRELDEALRIRPDFCASYAHLVTLALMQGRPDDARAAIARAQKAEACPAHTVKTMECQVAAWVPFLANDWQGVWHAENTTCDKEKGEDPVLELWAALKTGRRVEAEQIVARVRDELAKLPAGAPSRRGTEAVLAHMEGALLLAQGKPVEAAERLRFADQDMSYRGLDPGIFKLVNRVVLAQALRAAGSGEQAEAILADAQAVNANFVDRLKALTVARTPS
jgi:tetratricopeptide (TPR) repeat protein